MSSREIKFCDLCKEKIEFQVNRDIMIDGGKGYQEWPVNEEIYEVCSCCCLALDNARRLGIVDFDEGQIFERAGYIKRGTDGNGIVWVYDVKGSIY